MKKKDNIDDEAWRRATLHMLAMLAGTVTAFLAWLIDALPISESNYFREFGAIIAFGLLASGGSGFWNSILDYTNRVKDIKKAEAKQKTADANESVGDRLKTSSETKPRKTAQGQPSGQPG
jgi:hypothetical protein